MKLKKTHLPLPPLKLDHLYRLTDCTGIIQHSFYSLPDRSSGYTTDDNARALIVALRLWCSTGEKGVLALAERYLAFLSYVQEGDGKLHNFVDYSRRFVDLVGSEDAQGRAVWALGTAMALLPASPIGRNARRVFDRMLPWLGELEASRAISYALLGLAQVAGVHPEKQRLGQLLHRLADVLVERYRATSSPGWYWFEDSLTYSNAVMPLALLEVYRTTGNQRYRRIALESLRFLQEVVFPRGYLQVVGNEGWYRRGGRRAFFDEQPVDAGLMVLACLTASELGEREFLEPAFRAFAWFHGENSLGAPLYDPDTGGCCDGLTPRGPNANQGAESLLAYLLAYTAMKEACAKTSTRISIEA